MERIRAFSGSGEIATLTSPILSEYFNAKCQYHSDSDRFFVDEYILIV